MSVVRGYQVSPALVEVINRANAGTAYHELPAGAAGGGPWPMHSVRRIGGTTGDTDRAPRYVVETLADTLGKAEKAAEDVRDFLCWAPAWQSSYHGTSYGLIDDIEPVAEPSSVPFADGVRRVSVQYEVDFRDTP